MGSINTSRKSPYKAESSLTSLGKSKLRKVKKVRRITTPVKIEAEELDPLNEVSKLNTEVHLCMSEVISIAGVRRRGRITLRSRRDGKFQ